MLTCIESRHTIVVTIGVCQEVLAIGQSFCHVGWEIIWSIGDRSQRIHLKHSCQHATILIVLRNRANIIFFNLIGCTHLEPRLDLIFRIDGSGHTAINVIIAFYHTIIIKIGERKVIVAVLVTTIETYVMLLHVSLAIDGIYPRGIGLAIPVLEEVILCESLAFLHILDILLCIHELGHLG